MHPIYTGHLLMGLGTAIGSGLLVAFAGLALFFGKRPVNPSGQHARLTR